MNVLSRIIAALVALALTKLGAWLGVEFTDADTQSVTLWLVTALVALYGILHPLVRARLLAWRGKQEAPPIPQHTASVVTPTAKGDPKTVMRP